MIGGRRDMPLNRDSTGRFLPWLIAVMVYLASLATMGALTMTKIANEWQSSLTGQLTVQVPVSMPAVESRDAAEDEQVQILLALLKGTPGVESAILMPLDEINQLLEPWLGVVDASASLPLPRLISVTVSPDAPFDMAGLREELQSAVPGTTVDDHQQWLNGLLDLAGLIKLVALLVVVLVGLSAVIMVVFVTRMGLAVHRQIIELLHLIGAHDAYVARQFQWHALKLGLRGGLIGLLCAGATLFLADHFVSRLQASLLPDLALTPLDWLLLVAVPLIAALITLITARITVLQSLARLL